MSSPEFPIAVPPLWRQIYCEPADSLSLRGLHLQGIFQGHQRDSWHWVHVTVPCAFVKFAKWRILTTVIKTSVSPLWVSLWQTSSVGWYRGDWDFWEMCWHFTARIDIDQIAKWKTLF
jgi:hypothetical protein